MDLAVPRGLVMLPVVNVSIFYKILIFQKYSVQFY